ncbi:MAG: lipopolysaccharide heptosyltransferase II [Planctomycetota bacterium]|jgi:heptosyltransferase-2
MRRILVIQTASYLGDLVLTTPLLRALRETHPDATITVLTAPLGARLFAAQPYADALLVHRKHLWHEVLVLARRMRAAGFEGAIAAHRSFRSGLLLRLSGAPLRVGYAGATGSFAYGVKVRRDQDVHAVHRYLALGAPLGVVPERADPRPELVVDEAALERARLLLREAGVTDRAQVLSIAPGSMWATKRWLPEGFAAVADAARERGLTPVLIGTADELALCREVAALCAVEPALVVGRTGIPELIALLARSRALVSNDSGPAHVASAVGTPVVTIFGPTVPAFGFTPFGERSLVAERAGLECRPCDKHGPQRCPLGHFRCMRELSPRHVLEQLDRALAADRASPGAQRTARPG